MADVVLAAIVIFILFLAGFALGVLIVAGALTDWSRKGPGAGGDGGA